MKEGDVARLKQPVIEGEVIAVEGDRVLLAYKVHGEAHRRWFDKSDLEPASAGSKASAKKR